MQLKELNIDKSARVIKINNTLEMTKRLNDLGFFENSIVTCKLKGPFNKIKAYLINDTLIAIRDKDAENIEVNLI